MMYKAGVCCRCYLCWGRRTLRQSPKWYRKIPKCLYCGTRTMFEDKYRMRKERGRVARKNICDCHGYGFKHRRGGGWCIWGKPKTDAEHADRHGYGPCPF